MHVRVDTRGCVSLVSCMCCVCSLTPLSSSTLAPAIAKTHCTLWADYDGDPLHSMEGNRTLKPVKEILSTKPSRGCLSSTRTGFHAAEHQNESARHRVADAMNSAGNQNLPASTGSSPSLPMGDIAQERTSDGGRGSGEEGSGALAGDAASGGAKGIKSKRISFQGEGNVVCLIDRNDEEVSS